MKKYIVDFNDIKENVRLSYLFAMIGLIALCFTHAFLDPWMIDFQPNYRVFILVCTLLVTTLSTVAESVVIAVTVKTFMRGTKFKNVFIVMFAYFLLLNSVIGVVLFILSFIINKAYAIIVLNIILKSFLYLASLKKSFGNNIEMVGHTEL